MTQPRERLSPNTSIKANGKMKPKASSKRVTLQSDNRTVKSTIRIPSNRTDNRYYTKNPKRGPGRPPGTPNRTPAAAVQAVFDGLSKYGEDGKGKGGLAGFVFYLAKTEPKTAGALLARIMPQNIKVGVDPNSAMGQLMAAVSARMQQEKARVQQPQQPNPTQLQLPLQGVLDLKAEPAPQDKK